MERMDDGQLVEQIGVVSDTHENPLAFEKAILKHNEISIWIHCGDGIDHCLYLKELFKNKKFFFVRGNCDYLTEPYERWNEINNLLFWITHGHREKVKQGLNELIYTARTGGAQVVFYGHTHCYENINIDGIRVLNPGSLGYEGTYLTLDISHGEVGNIMLRKIEKQGSF